MYKPHLKKQTARMVALAMVLSTALTTLPTARAEANVYISEINWAGSELSNADEWLELYNPLEESIDLTGWSIEGAATGDDPLELPDNTLIEPNSTYLIANYDQEDSTLNTEPDFITTSLSLSNSAIGLVLRDGSGTEIDLAGDGGPPHAGVSGTGELESTASMNRTIPVLAGDLPEAWQNSTTTEGFDEDVVQLGTPGQHHHTPPQEPDSESEPEEEDGCDPDTTDHENEEGPGNTDLEPDTNESNETDPEPEPSTETEPLEPGDVLINEVVSDPTSGPEWVEVINASSQAIDLTGWTIREAGGSRSELDDEVTPREFAVAEFSSRLNNAGDIITLHDPTGQEIDRLAYGDVPDSSVEAAKDPNAMARDSENKFVITTTPTKGSENFITFPVQEAESDEEEHEPETEAEEEQRTHLELSVLYPNPVDDEMHEFIQIRNTGEDVLDLVGWRVADLSKSFGLNGALAAGTVLELPRSTTGIALNNSNETVTLFAPDGSTIDTTTYETAIEGATYLKTEHGWIWSGVSPGTEQELVSQDGKTDSRSETTAGDRDDVEETSTSTQETIMGVVIAPPGLFGKQIMYIHGRQLYQYQGDFPSLAIGDVVRAAGEPSTARGEPRLKLAGSSAIEVVGQENPQPEPMIIGELSDHHVGRLVQVTGVMVERTTDRFILENESQELTVIIKEQTGISLSGISAGNDLTVTGVLSTYDGELRLLPRSPEDIQDTDQRTHTAIPAAPTDVALPPKQSSTDVLVGATLAVVTSGILIALAVRHKRKQKLLLPDALGVTP